MSGLHIIIVTLNSFQPEDPPYCFMFFSFLNKNIMARVSFTGCPCLSSWSLVYRWYKCSLPSGYAITRDFVLLNNLASYNLPVGDAEGLEVGIPMSLTCSRSYKNTHLHTKNVVNRLLESTLDGSICLTNTSSYFMLYTELGMEMFVLINNISDFVFMIKKF